MKNKEGIEDALYNRKEIENDDLSYRLISHLIALFSYAHVSILSFLVVEAYGTKVSIYSSLHENTILQFVDG